jgi:hypothetical protein
LLLISLELHHPAECNRRFALDENEDRLAAEHRNQHLK